MAIEPDSPVSAASTTADRPAALSGRLGVADIFFSVVAFAAPLLVVVGLLPAMIGFAGEGLIAGFASTGVILLFFSVGYTTITRYVDRPGAFYAYITSGLGRPAGLGGAYTATLAYLLLLLSTWVAFGVFGRQLIHDTLHGPDIPWYVVSMAGTLIAGALSFFRIELSAKALTVALLLEVAIVVVFDLFVFTDGGPDGIATRPFTLSGATQGSFGLAVLYGGPVLHRLRVVGPLPRGSERPERHHPPRDLPRRERDRDLLPGRQLGHDHGSREGWRHRRCKRRRDDHVQ